LLVVAIVEYAVMLGDLPERRLLAYYGDDHVPWQHRVLLEKIHGTAYILATPYQQIRVQDAALLTLWSVANPAFPDLGGAIYSFDRDLSKERLASLRVEGRMLYEILGAAATAASLEAGLGVAWLVADPVNEPFGNLAPAAGHTSPNRPVTRGSLGLAKIDGEWMFFERGGVVHTPVWREGERARATRDPRPRPPARPADSSHPVPAEPPTGVVTSGNECVPDHQHGGRNSGIPPHAGVAIEQGELSSISPPATSFDLWVLSRVYGKYIFEIPKKGATVLKRQRLYSEETVADTKRKKGKYGPEDEEGGAE
jgi:hypothetical protein